jgi:hypothetical protein
LDTQTIINLGLGIILTGGGWFARQMWDAMKELRADLHRLEVALPSKYVVKDDFVEAMKDVKAEITKGFDRIYDKLDGKADKV